MAKSMHKHSDRQKPWREYTDYPYVLLREVQVQPYFITRGITEITQTAETSYCLWVLMSVNSIRRNNMIWITPTKFVNNTDMKS